MSRKKRILLAVACDFLALLIYGGYRIYRAWDYEFWEPHMLTLKSPSGAGWAHLVWDGALMGRELNLLVSSSPSGEDARWVGVVNCADGIKYTGLSEQRAKLIKLTHGYDFLQKQRYAPRNNGEHDDDPEIAIERSALLEKLLQERGGSVRVNPVEGELYSIKMKDLGWAEWRVWRERLRAAKRKETR